MFQRSKPIQCSFWCVSLMVFAGLTWTTFAQDNKGTPAQKEKSSESGPDGVVHKRARNSSEFVDFAVTVKPDKAKRGEVITLKVTITPKAGQHLYPFTDPSPEAAGLPTEIKYADSSQFKPLWDSAKESEPQESKDGISKEHHDPFTWTQEIVVMPEAEIGKQLLEFSIKYQICDEKRCLPPKTDHFKVPVNIEKGGSGQLSDELQQRLQIVKDSQEDSSEGGLIAFMLQGVFWGAVSLITPCVFPMIPITVSFFLKKAEDKDYRPVFSALVYSGTIVIVLTAAAVLLLSLFRNLSTNPWMNAGLGLLFVYFALSLFGMYEIQLPSGLAKFTSSREGSGVFGTIFMALTFTIISFACVAPFLGGFTGTAASTIQGRSILYPILGGLAFSITFAAPFFVLALFPTLLKKMPSSGSWLNSVKVVMGFLELAAAFNFFRVAELVAVSEVNFFTYDFVLGIYVTLCVLCGCYLLGLFRLPHDSPIETIGVPRMLLSVLFICLGLYLTPALFKDSSGKRIRPGGAIFAWVDAFLISDEQDELPWERDLNIGLAKAKTTSKSRVFIDFTGKTCKNCAWNEKNIFTQEEVQELLQQYNLVQLYTDQVPSHLYTVDEKADGLNVEKQTAEAQQNLQFQRDVFGTEQLPLYAIVEPNENGKYQTPNGEMKFNIIRRYSEGKINNSDAFLQFLRNNLPKKSVTTPTAISNPEN